MARLPRLALPDEILPVTDNDESVPTLVIFGCEFVVTVLAVVAVATAPETLLPGILVNPAALPVNTPVFATILAAVIFPFTPRPVNVPKLVTFG